MTPDQYTIQEFMLPVGDGHELYVQDWGNPKAKLPVVYLHGGPGSGVSNKYRQKVDPSKQRVIFFDQRGAGQSLPVGSLENNTTQDLIGDITKVADHLNIKHFVLAGGSWGSCLALAYGIAYPARVTAMVLNGILTGTQDEISWLDKGGFRDFFPDVWEEYLLTVPASHRGNPSTYHFEQVFGNDNEAAKVSAYNYQLLEMALLKLDDQFTPPDFESFDPSAIRLEMHYMKHSCFLPDNFILKNAAKLTMPIYLIQGRYDMVCRPAVAAKLHQTLPNSELIWTVNGHSGQHESNTIQKLLLLRATGEA